MRELVCAAATLARGPLPAIPVRAVPSRRSDEFEFPTAAVELVGLDSTSTGVAHVEFDLAMSLAKSQMSDTDGLYGYRVNHNLDVQLEPITHAQR